MALTIEDGSIVAGANSYATVAELRAYAAERGATVPVADADCEVLLIKAMDYLEGQWFVGDTVSPTQALSWPRQNVYIEQWPLAIDEIPRQLVQAQCALAIEAPTVALLPTRDVNEPGAVISKSVAGAVSVAYANPDRTRNVPAIAKARALLRLLLVNNGLTVIRS